MRIGLIIQNYRQMNSISMEYFAKKCGLSKAYIGMLEKGVHPKSGKPITPSIETIKKVAYGMGLDFDTLFNSLDEDVALNDDIIKESADADPYVDKMKDLLSKASPEQKEQILKVAKALLLE